MSTNFLPNFLTRQVSDAPYLQIDNTVPDNPLADLMFDGYGNLLGMNSIDQQVLLACITIRGTAIDPKVGTGLETIETIGANFAALVENEIEDALSVLVGQRKIKIQRILTIIDPIVKGRYTIRVFYMNNQYNKQQVVNI